MDKRITNGGKRKGAGRKSKAEEQKVNNLFVNALKQLYDKETDDDAKVDFIKKGLFPFERGKIFIGEHVFGKAPQEVKQTNLNIEAKDLTEAEIKKINKALDDAY
jgi:hypothetical protein